MMKVIGIVGSPRKGGNTDTLVRTVLRQAEKSGIETKTYYLSDLNFSGCVGCYGCKQQETCVLDDDATEILQAITAAAGVVLGTPVYFAQMTGQLKLLLDRMFSFKRADFSSKLEPGKKMALVVSQGQTDAELYSWYFDPTGEILQGLGFEGYKSLIIGGNRRLDAADHNERALQAARMIGQWLAEPQ